MNTPVNPLPLEVQKLSPYTRDFPVRCGAQKLQRFDPPSPSVDFKRALQGRRRWRAQRPVWRGVNSIKGRSMGFPMDKGGVEMGVNESQPIDNATFYGGGHFEPAMSRGEQCSCGSGKQKLGR